MCETAAPGRLESSSHGNQTGDAENPASSASRWDAVEAENADPPPIRQAYSKRRGGVVEGREHGRGVRRLTGGDFALGGGGGNPTARHLRCFCFPRKTNSDGLIGKSTLYRESESLSREREGENLVFACKESAPPPPLWLSGPQYLKWPIATEGHVPNRPNREESRVSQTKEIRGRSITASP